MASGIISGWLRRMNLTYATGCLFCTLPSHNNYSGELVAERQLLPAHPHKPLDTAVGVFLDRPDWTSAASHWRVQPRDVCPSPLRERRGWELERVCVGMYGVRALCPVGVQVHAPSGTGHGCPGADPLLRDTSNGATAKQGVNSPTRRRRPR